MARGRRPEVLAPSVAPRVARGLEVCECVVDSPQPEQRQAAGEAGGRELERAGAAAGIIERRVGNIHRTLEITGEGERSAGQPPADPLRRGVLQQRTAVPGTVRELDHLTRRLAVECGLERS